MFRASDCNMLAAMQESRFTIWYHPAVIYVDRGLLPKTVIEKESVEFGKHPVIIRFVGNNVAIRRADGSLVNTGVDPYPAVLHRHAASGHWEDATKLCRFVKDPVLWSCLAGMSLHARVLATAEVAYAAIQEADKVHYIQYIKELPLKDVRNAEMAVMTGHYQDAENILLQAGLTFRAILLNIHLHQWERALDLSIKVTMITGIVSTFVVLKI